MAFPGEVGHIDTNCVECGEHLPAKVLRSGPRFFIGTCCPNCGPYSRESGYYPTPKAAQEALDNNNFSRM